MYHMTWHELLSLTPEKKVTVYILMFFKELVYKDGEADELQLRKGNYYDM